MMDRNSAAFKNLYPGLYLNSFITRILEYCRTPLLIDAKIIENCIISTRKKYGESHLKESGSS